MKFRTRNLSLTFALLIVPCANSQTRAQDAEAPYRNAAPIDQYLMERNAEIDLARSAAPKSISGDADVLVLGRQGYETAAKGKNGFVCLVQRSWTAGFDDPEFWNPKLRAPICFNPPAVRSYLPRTVRKTEWVMAGQSKAHMFDEMKTAVEKGELPAMEPGAMCYMMSKQGYLGDRTGHWHPHLMFFTPPTVPVAWGAGLPGSPVLGFNDTTERLTVFMIPVGRWSDGTVAPLMQYDDTEKSKL